MSDFLVIGSSLSRSGDNYDRSIGITVDNLLDLPQLSGICNRAATKFTYYHLGLLYEFMGVL